MKDAEKLDLFAHCPVWKAVVKLAVPTVISQIILVVYNMADTFFIGLTGSDAMITAVTVCMPAFMFLSAISNLFGVGGASVIARALGAEDNDRAQNTAGFAFWGCVAVTLLYSVFAWIFEDTFMNLLGGRDPEVHAAAIQYLRCTVIVGGVATSLNALLGHLVRSEGYATQASIGIAMGGILNIGLDPLFMFVLLPKGQEVLGAAIATTLSNLIATVYFLVLMFVRRGRSVLNLKPNWKMFSFGIPGDVMATGLPACLMTLCENISYAVLDNLMSLCGTVMQAGVGVAKKVNMLAHCIVRGMAQGVLPLIAFNFASGNLKRMKSAVTISTSISVLMATLCMAASLLFSRTLIGLFIQHVSSSVDYGAAFLRILCIGGPFSACAYAFISFFQATGEGMRSFILAILRKGILDIPLMFILKEIIPIYGIVWATPIADILCCIVALILFTRQMRRYAVHPQFAQ